MSQASVSAERAPGVIWATLFLGIPLGAGFVGLVNYGPLGQFEGARYVKHPVECVEVILFTCAMVAFAAKLLRLRQEKRALRLEIIPARAGGPIPVSQAASFIERMGRLPKRLTNTYCGRRIAAVLDFLNARGSANELDDQLRALADNDSIALESSYSLTRFITWAIPILGFLGTVLGITQAITGVTPEKLEKELSSVTDGLALAFDATALGLALTMVTMFLSFLVERGEQRVLEAVDSFAERRLSHYFARADALGAGTGDHFKQQTDLLLLGVQELVHKQAEIWSASLAELNRRHVEQDVRQQQRLQVALESALDTTLQAHSRRVAELEKQASAGTAGAIERLAAQAGAVCNAGRDQQQAVAKILQSMAAQAQTWARLQEDEKELLKLQHLLNQNLQVLAGAGAFEQAVHSLTAAIHLMTTRATPVLASDGQRLSSRPGAAA